MSIHDIRDTAKQLSTVSATEGNLELMRDLIVHGLTMIANELEGYAGVPPISDEPLPVLETKEIPADKLPGHKKGSKKKSGD